MSTTSFGQVIPVTGPNIGFPGAVSRFGDRIITARPLLAAALSNLNFGDPAVLIPNTVAGVEDSFDSVKDFIAQAAANVGLVAQYFAGMAVREVKTQLTYGAGITPGIQQVGYYSAGQMAEVLERGSGTIPLAVGAPFSQSPVYTRVVLNAAVPAGLIGDWETNPAATDLFNTTATAAAGATAVTLASGANTVNGQLISGQGIPAGTYIVSGGGTTAIVISQPTTAALAAGTVVTISNLVLLPTVVARTGYLDANRMLEITIKGRVAA